MDICITPALLGGREQAVPSKSHAHRLLLCAALCRESTLLHIPAPSVDILVTMDCLRALGCQIDPLPGGDFRLTPPEVFSPSPDLFCRESGSTLRFCCRWRRPWERRPASPGKDGCRNGRWSRC